MRHIIIILTSLMAALLMQGCCTQRKIASESTSSDSTRVEIRYKEVYIHDTLYITLPSQSVERETNDTSSHLETKYASSDARINQDGTLYHSLKSKDVPVPVPTEQKVVYKDSIVYRDRNVYLTETKYVERELTSWQKWQMRSFWILLSVLLAILIYRFRKPIWSFIRMFI